MLLSRVHRGAIEAAIDREKHLDVGKSITDAATEKLRIGPPQPSQLPYTKPRGTDRPSDFQEETNAPRSCLIPRDDGNLLVQLALDEDFHVVQLTDGEIHEFDSEAPAGSSVCFSCAWDDSMESILEQETRRMADDFALLVEDEKGAERVVNEEDDDVCVNQGSLLCLSQLMMCAEPTSSTGRHHQRMEAFELPSEQDEPLRI